MACTKSPAIRKIDKPDMVVEIKTGATDFDTKANQWVDSILARYLPCILVKLVSRCKNARPICVLFEGK
ncbi:hypothetical protein T9A_02396 [Alcanivorax jadensis T9]|uniref:Uncharacterized protein n=1 Tax=Alcanivorax jadensis T9 TaxID=1177181 RepID=A0ABR4WCH4_9GAMM|nr:hypothetical protein T9A_02396 [Alcanivorax jadensis T9]